MKEKVAAGSAFIRPYVETQGGFIRYGYTDTYPTPPDEFRAAKRGNVTGFSYQSRRRMSQRIGGIREDAPLPALLTLTLPAAYTWANLRSKNSEIVERTLSLMDPAHHGAMFKRFGKRLRREYPALAGLWRLEFQRRGAPHWHMALWLNGAAGGFPMPKAWAARAWYESVASGDERHLRAGTKLEKPRAKAAVYVYMCKELGKAHQSGPRQMSQFFGTCGRSWGVIRSPVIDAMSHPRATRFIKADEWLAGQAALSVHTAERTRGRVTEATWTVTENPDALLPNK